MTICLSAADVLLNHGRAAPRSSNQNERSSGTALAQRRLHGLNAGTKIALETKVDHDATCQVLLVSMDIKSPANVVKSCEIQVQSLFGEVPLEWVEGKNCQTVELIRRCL